VIQLNLRIFESRPVFIVVDQVANISCSWICLWYWVVWNGKVLPLSTRRLKWSHYNKYENYYEYTGKKRP